MRILYWTPLFWPGIGGIEVLSSRLLPALQVCGHEFLVITSDEGFDVPSETAFRGIAVHRFPFGEAVAGRDIGRIASIQRRVGELKRAFGPDLVHLHHPGAIAFFHLATREAERRPGVAGRRAGLAPSVMTIHTPFPDATGAADTIFARSLRDASWVTAVSRATLDDVLARVPDIRDRASVIHNGVPVPSVSPVPLPQQPHIVCLGRLAREKGVDLAVRAFATVKRTSPGLRMTIAGDGPERVALEAQALALGVSSDVTFTGWVQPGAVPALMNTATLVVVPSRYREPFGLVAVEAALLGRPVVAARTGGLVEIVEEGVTGVLFEPGDEAALARAVAGLLGDAALAARMGAAARDRARARFSLDACVEAYDRLYRGLG